MMNTDLYGYATEPCVTLGITLSASFDSLADATAYAHRLRHELPDDGDFEISLNSARRRSAKAVGPAMTVGPTTVCGTVLDPSSAWPLPPLAPAQEAAMDETAGIEPPAAPAAPEEPAPAPAKPKRAPRAAKAAEPTPEEAPPFEGAPVDAPPAGDSSGPQADGATTANTSTPATAEPTTPEVDVEVVRSAVCEKMKQGHRGAVFSRLKSIGIETVSEIPPELRAEFLAFVRAL